MSSFLYEAGIIHNPGHHGSVSFHHRQDKVAHSLEQGFVTPRGIGYEMMERLVHALHIIGGQPRRHRLDALAFTGKQ